MMLARTRIGRRLQNVRRTVWTCSTLISTSPAALVERLASSPLPASPPALTVYSISKNIPAALIPTIQSTLPSAPSLGAITELLPTSATSHLAPSLDLQPSEEAYSIAVASYHPTGTARVIPFQSSLTGRPNISLGREIKQSAGEDEVDAGFEAFLSGKKWGFGDNSNLKEGKRATIQELDGVEPADVKQIVFLTADRIQPFLGALSTYPVTAKIGLVGSSTPFHSSSGAPFSLYHDGNAASAGAVGVAVVDSAPSKAVTIDYAGLESFGDVMQVTNSKGNIVLTLSEQNAARLLLNAVQALPKPGDGSADHRMEEKDKEFYAAIFDSKPELPLDLTTARHVSQIMAGDPSRGAMSVDTEEEVKQGFYLAFLHRPAPSSSPSPPAGILQPNPAHSLTFLSVPSSHSPPQSLEDTPRKGNVVVLDSFVAASENGVIVSKVGGAGSWVCKIQGLGERLE